MKCSLGTWLGLSKVVKKKSPQIRSPDLPEDLCREFSLAGIKVATNNFHPDSRIGIDGFGTVYKGTTDDGIMVAVKRYKIESLRQFRNEVQILYQLRHPHLVSLIGLCHEQNEMILVYEYMSGGLLSDYLFGKTYEPLCWKQRLEVCIGVARGLHYLHTGAKRAVIHRDVKTWNIILDDKWSSKLANFSFSIIGPPSMSKSLFRMPPNVAGTVEYMAPEVRSQGTLLTDKSDAFSFGLVLFEVLCGRSIWDCDTEKEDQMYLIIWVYQCLKDGTIYQAIDPYLKGNIAPSCLQKFLEIAFSCCILQADKRPALGEVEATLELALELQNRADSETECINPHGHGKTMHEEVLFSLPSINYSDYFLDREGSISTIKALSNKSSRFSNQPILTDTKVSPR